MKYYAKEGQDKAAHLLLGDNGFFLDIGCQYPCHQNNTYALELLGWNGLLFDLVDHNAKEKRAAPFFKVDVRTNDFCDILVANSPTTVDFISLDVDDSSLAALQAIFEAKISFKFMTFEHDLYRRGDSHKTPSVNMLKKRGYRLLFENVCFEHKGKSHAFEDWWVGDVGHESFLNWKDCVNMLKEKPCLII